MSKKTENEIERGQQQQSACCGAARCFGGCGVMIFVIFATRDWDLALSTLRNIRI
jgi:hypothetical protein